MVESGSGWEVISCTEATSTFADAPAIKANFHIIPLACPTRTTTVSLTVTQDAHSSVPERAPPSAENLTGKGERLGGGGRGGDDGDDGSNPDDWNVVDDGRDGNAKKKDDDEDEVKDDILLIRRTS